MRKINSSITKVIIERNRNYIKNIIQKRCKYSGKARAALMLGVSMWIWEGGSAFAESVTTDTVISDNQSGTAYTLVKDSDGTRGSGVEFTVAETGEVQSINSIKSGNTVIVESGGKVNGDIRGGVNNNEVNIAGKVSVNVYGGFSSVGEPVSGNSVILSGEVRDAVNVVGGYSSGGNVNNNSVSITGYVFYHVFGGYTGASGAASGNHVEVIGGKVQGQIFGGKTGNGNATNNTIRLHDANLSQGIYGGYTSGDAKTGNVLLISGNNRTKGINNFETIRLAPEVEWNAVSPVLDSSDGFKDCDTFDISDAENLFNRTDSGVMPLLHGSSSINTLENIKLKYSKEEAVSIPVGVGGLVVKTGSRQTSSKNGVGVVYGDVHRVARAFLSSAGLEPDARYISYIVENKASNIVLGEIEWHNGGISRTLTDAENVSFAINSGTVIDKTGFSFNNPESVAGGESMTLLKNANGLTSGDSIAALQAYEYTPVDGVKVNAEISGSISRNSDNVGYTAAGNKASKLTFGNVAWKSSEEGALLTRPGNISFDGADVDISNINFINISELEAKSQMTLVADFGSSIGNITGTAYKVGSTLQGEGMAELVDSDGDGIRDALRFTALTRANGLSAQAQTHNTVMASEACMAALWPGHDYILDAADGLSERKNTGADGIAAFAKAGANDMSISTGSHVKVNSWDGILALGHKNEKKFSSTTYGAFVEYGSGNYATFNDNERGDGSIRYTGGGILGKWKNEDGLYTEWGIGAGTVSNDASDILRAANGASYKYSTDVPYWRTHLGFGRKIRLKNEELLDLYIRYFHNHLGSVAFHAGGYYELDSVNSNILRIGSRYTSENDKCSIYGGIALEHEFSGRAGGFADSAVIRNADISGTSIRGEIGAVLRPDKNSPLALDLNITGFAGQKRGINGGVSVVFSF